jgi:hypothetical protein
MCVFDRSFGLPEELAEPAKPLQRQPRALSTNEAQPGAATHPTAVLSQGRRSCHS